MQDKPQGNLDSPLEDLQPGWHELNITVPTPTPYALPGPLLSTAQCTGTSPSPIPVDIGRISDLVQAFEQCQAGVHPTALGLQLGDLLPMLPSPADFRAAWPGRASTHFEQYFDLLGHGPDTAKVLAIMREGFRISWVKPHSRPQQAHPKHEANLACVRENLARVVGEDKVPSMLNRSTPAPVIFPNRQSALVNEAFVAGALAQLLEVGAIKEVPPEEVHVISPLGVVGDPDKKARLILDAMYINAFDKYVPFHYESLRDIPILASPTDVVLITDFKSGYHHIPLHPSVHKYLGIRFQNRTYCFTVLPFGLASACRVFTEIMLEIWRPLRDRGIRSLLYIDDIMSFFQGGPSALVGRALVLSVLVFLHWVLSIGKCVFTLPVEGKMLGLWCNVQKGFFKVPSDKAQALIQGIQDFLTHGGTKRDLAKLTGKLVSVAPAIQLAPLYTRRLFQSIGEGATWTSTLGDEQIALAADDLRYFEAALQLNAGWRWSPRVDVHEFTCAGDASETGYGGYSSLLHGDMVLPFDAHDQARMHAGHLSSTLREVKNACFLISTCLRHNPGALAGGTLVCYCDNQGAVANMNKMRGSPEEVAAIRDMWVLATALDVQIRVEWRPRESAEIAKADALSRVEDPSDFALNFQETSRLMRLCGTPTGDAFAGPWGHARKAAVFFTAGPCHVAAGWDALMRDWDVLGDLIWVFPPISLVREALVKVKAHGRNCILILPNLTAHLKRLVRTLPVVDSKVIHPYPGMFELGSKLPKEMQYPPFACKLDCFLIRFHRK
jgi:hypothetical protein